MQLTQHFFFQGTNFKEANVIFLTLSYFKYIMQVKIYLHISQERFYSCYYFIVIENNTGIKDDNNLYVLVV